MENGEYLLVPMDYLGRVTKEGEVKAHSEHTEAPEGNSYKLKALNSSMVTVLKTNSSTTIV